MKCNYCGREITKDEEFYETRYNILCNNCIKEIVIFHYMRKDGIVYSNNEMYKYNNIDTYVKDLKNRLKWLEDAKIKLEEKEKLDVFNTYALMKCKKDIIDIKNLLNEIEGDVD